jgi:YVTN family beta-propeller protein/probable HAF family extracellular repeat protein
MARSRNAARILITVFVLAIVFGLMPLTLSAQQFITVSYPGSTYTYPTVINNRGEIVGYYFDSGGVFHGFTLLNGQYATLNVAGAADTFASGINDLGEIVGAYVQNGTTHGFLFDGATYSTIDFPGSDYTALSGINNLGQIVGIYENAGFSVIHGFSFKAGVFTTIDFPGSNPSNYPNQVNNFGVIAGGYIDTSSVYHGFVYDAGTFTSINFPGATNTTVTGISDGGELAGAYCDSVTCPFFTPGPQKYFTETNGQFKTVDVPTAGEVSNLNLELNNAGQLVAAYQDSAGNAHGAVSAIGPFAYVGNATSPSCCTLTVLDTSTNLALTTIPISGISQPFGITPDQSHIYVAVGNAVDVINATTNSLVGTITGVGSGANAVAIAPNGTFGYVANAGTNTSSVPVFSTATNQVVATVPVGIAESGSVSITPDGKFVYVGGGIIGSSETATMAVISTATNSVVSTFPVSGLTGSDFGPFFIRNGAFGYVAQFAPSVTPGLVAVLTVPSNTVTQTVAVGTLPTDIAITPDGAYAYVANEGSNNVSVIDTSSNTVIATVPVGNQPDSIAITPDGALAYVANLADSTVSVIQTSTNSVVATIPVPSPFGILITSAPPMSQSITQPLSPTAPNQFNYGPHNFTVQYPAGTEFSGVNMTVVAVQATQASIQQRLAGTQFANAACIVYSGAGGNCVDYQVTCTNTSGSQITCPSESAPTIVVKSSFDTLQPITNPGFLTTPIGTNDWTNIFDSFFLQRIDPTMKAKTSGFSEFVAVDLGATNNQGAGAFRFQAPLLSSDQRVFPVGESIPVKFHLASVANLAVPISDATAGITVVMISDAFGNPTTNLILEKPASFTYSGGNYAYSLNTTGYAAGTYNITVYGNAFVAQQVEFTLTAPAPARISTTLQSLSQNQSSNQYVAVFKVSNTGGTAAKNLAITASKLNSASTTTTLPITLGSVSAGSSVNVTLSFPATAGAPSSSGEVTISESYAGGTSGGGFRVTLP